ncbi:MAG: DUF4168 domain-containing protein [Spirochaetaceae bacterium]
MKHTAKTLVRFSVLLFLLIGVGLGLYAQEGMEDPGQDQQQQDQQQQEGMEDPGQQQQQQAPDVDPESEEFNRFVDALETVQEVQQEVNEEIDGVIADSSMSEEEFGEIHQQLQGQPDREDGQGADISDDEREEYRSLIDEIGAAQEDSQEEMISAIEENDMNVERFNEIMMAARSDAELQERLQEEMSN